MLTLISPSPTDADLLRRVRGGSLEALGALYERHAGDVLSAAYRLLSSRPDAEDVMQDVFVGLPEALRRYDEKGSFSAWLGRVAVRTALMRMRAQRRRREAPQRHAEWLPATGKELGVERVAAARALQSLPEGLRIVWVLKEIEGYSHAEIAGLLDISASASAVRLFRAWRSLRKELCS
jgi:RNA polymerase sigma-70 factor, ECF subfamily